MRNFVEQRYLRLPQQNVEPCASRFIENAGRSLAPIGREDNGKPPLREFSDLAGRDESRGRLPGARSRLCYDVGGACSTGAGNGE